MVAIRLAVVILCVGAVTFLLRFLVALLKECRSLPPQSVKLYFAKFTPSKQRGGLIIMNPDVNKREFPIKAGKRVALVVLVATCLALPLHGQEATNAASGNGASSAAPQATAADQQSQQEIMNELAAMKKRIEQLEAELKKHQAEGQPTTVVHTAKAGTPLTAPPGTFAATAAPAEAVAVAAPPATSETKPAKAEPFAFADWTWLNGNPRTKEPAFDSKFFTPEIRADVAYHYDFNHPKDDTIGGSSEVFRSNEVSLTHLGVGGDFHYDHVRARVLSQIGLYSTARRATTPALRAANGTWPMPTGMSTRPMAAITLMRCMGSTSMPASSCRTWACSVFTNLITGRTSRLMFRRTRRGFSPACASRYFPPRS